MSGPKAGFHRIFMRKFMRAPDENGNADEPELLALRALAWAVSDEARASRLLALTGLDVAQLRARAGDPAVLSATIDFLASHEPDLIACAEALDIAPDHLAAAARSLAL